MSKGVAKLAMARGLGVWVLDAPGGFGNADFHSHHAIQISISLGGRLELECEGTRLEAPVLAVRPDARHRLIASGLLAFVFVEPESPTGRALCSLLFGQDSLTRVDNPICLSHLERLGTTLTPGLTPDQMLAIAASALATLVPDQIDIRCDPRIDRVILQAIENPGIGLQATAAAAGVHLSASRVRHLFVEQTGLAFKTYMLWHRLIVAVEHYASGESLTQAAHAAGFADSAHFSRTFRRTFGLPATTLTRL